MLGEGGSVPTRSSARLFASLADWQRGPDLRQDLIDLALLRMAELAAALTTSELWDEDGYTTPIQWLREVAMLPTMVACQQVAAGFQLDTMPRSVAAVERGEIGFGHLALIADTAESYRDGGFDEGPFLAKAKEQNLSLFRKTCDHARHAQDPGGFARDEHELHVFAPSSSASRTAAGST